MRTVLWFSCHKAGLGRVEVAEDLEVRPARDALDDDKPAAADGKPAGVEDAPATVEEKPPAGVYATPTAEEAVRLPPITPVPEPVAVVTPENRSEPEAASVAVEAEAPRDAKAS